MRILLLFFIFTSFQSFASHCLEQSSANGFDWIHCPKKSHTLFPLSLNQREVLWSLPEGKAPRGGWPVVILSQGSWFPVEFSRPKGLPFGATHEIKLIRSLLDHGFAVIAPRATLRVGWITNLPHGDYTKTADFKVLSEVIRLIRSGFWGPLNPSRLYATGISSGGYQTSRLTLAFPRQFRAIAIQSASYATCLGPLCLLPKDLSEHHPPTLFLHGAQDRVVPFFTAETYYRKLIDRGINSVLVVDSSAGHAWLESAPEEITAWFKKY